MGPCALAERSNWTGAACSRSARSAAANRTTTSLRQKALHLSPAPTPTGYSRRERAPFRLLSRLRTPCETLLRRYVIGSGGRLQVGWAGEKEKGEAGVTVCVWVHCFLLFFFPPPFFFSRGRLQQCICLRLAFSNVAFARSLCVTDFGYIINSARPLCCLFAAVVN